MTSIESSKFIAFFSVTRIKKQNKKKTKMKRQKNSMTSLHATAWELKELRSEIERGESS